MTNYIACRDKPFSRAERRQLEAWIKDELARDALAIEARSDGTVKQGPARRAKARPEGERHD